MFAKGFKFILLWVVFTALTHVVLYLGEASYYPDVNATPRELIVAFFWTAAAALWPTGAVLLSPKALNLLRNVWSDLRRYQAVKLFQAGVIGEAEFEARTKRHN